MNDMLWGDVVDLSWNKYFEHPLGLKHLLFTMSVFEDIIQIELPWFNIQDSPEDNNPEQLEVDGIGFLS